jgi:hypothetical protein
MESEQEGDYFNQCLKSYLNEVRKTKLNALEYCPELEDFIDIGMDGKEAGGWSFYDSEWKLQDGKTADYLVRVLLANSGLLADNDYLQNIPKLLGILSLNDKNRFSSQDGKAFESSIMLILPPIRLIRALLNSSFLSVFECLFLIGYDNENGIINNSVHIANNAISKGIISPRDPDTNLKRNEAPAIRLNGERVIPDLSWLLTFEEAETWAVNSFGTSLKVLRDSLAITPPLDKPPTQTVNSTAPPTNTQTTDNEQNLTPHNGYSERNDDYIAWIKKDNPDIANMIKANIEQTLITRNNRLWSSGFNNWWKQKDRPFKNDIPTKTGRRKKTM